MTEAPGIPKVAKRYWGLMAAILGVMGGSLAILGIPSFVAIHKYAPSTIGFTAYAFAGWVFLYSAGTISGLKDIEQDEFDQLVNQMQWPLTGFILLIVGCYTNFLMVLSTGLGYGLVAVGAPPSVALIAAMLYPGLDTILGQKWFMPGKIVIMGVIWAFHAFGYIRDITVGDIYSVMGKNETTA